MRFRFITLISAAVLSASAAFACGFHSYVPQPTMVDRLLTSDHIVLARPEPDNPFKFMAVSAIEGPLDTVDIPNLVDSTTRRRLEANPDAHVLFARDGAYGPWLRLAYIDGEMQVVLDHALSNLQEWGGVDDSGRYEFFAERVASEESDVSQLALLELDQANYKVLRSLNFDLDPDLLSARLNVMTEAHLAPIRILLLGFSDASETSAFLKAGVDRNKKIGATALLGAYTTAWIENAGLEAIETLATGYLTDVSLPYESREMMIEAMAIHAETREPAISDAVRSAVASAIRIDPRLALAAARQFGVRNDWSLRAPVSEALRANKLSSVTDILLVSQYVALADEAGSATSN